MRFLPSMNQSSRSLAGTRCYAVARRLEDFNQVEHEVVRDKAGHHRHAIAELRNLFSRSSIQNNVVILETLRQLYPQHTVTQTTKDTGLLEFAKAGKATAVLDTASKFYASRTWETPRDWEIGKEPRLEHDVELGRYIYGWNGHEFQVFVLQYWECLYSRVAHYYILYPQQPEYKISGGSNAIDSLIEAAARHSSEINKEIWVYDRGYWSKNRKLWENVQVANWDNVILKQEVKETLMKDVEDFFDSREDYKGFAVPWKRGLIFHGLPGNGKTISIKALMHALSQRDPPIPTLYVKSTGRNVDSDDIRNIFKKARENTPCLLVLEDIDSLVNDDLKSFFLNEIDGLEGNDGIMVIGSTNYLDKLDAGISKRPSRFDRKYHFSLPATEERIKYCEHWRTKLAISSSNLSIPPAFSSAVANITEGFSFAYLQEAFVTALLSIVRSRLPPAEKWECIGMGSGSLEASSWAEAEAGLLERNPVWRAIKHQVEVLKKEMKDSRKSVEDAERNGVLSNPKTNETSSVGFGG
ncbi:hypothetical protein G7Y79_00016g040720 [Physcia stellaris]|nr:hypothetical protein G7Y79_00016g040720 [Physcia stellaris]